MQNFGSIISRNAPFFSRKLSVNRRIQFCGNSVPWTFFIGLTTLNQMSEQIEQKSEQLLSRKSLAQRWGCCTETLKRRERAKVLRPIRFNSRLLRYRVSEILAIESAAQSHIECSKPWATQKGAAQ